MIVLDPLLIHWPESRFMWW